MQEQIQRQLAALNAVIQRSASAAGERLDPTAVDALTRAYVDAWEALEACGITEWMLAYDPEALTFSLPAEGEQADHLFTTMPMPAVVNQTVLRQGHLDDPDTEPCP